MALGVVNNSGSINAQNNLALGDFLRPSALGEELRGMASLGTLLVTGRLTPHLNSAFPKVWRGA